MRNLRIVVGGGLGDCLLHTPFIRYFRTSTAYKRITCIVSHEALELLDRNPHIDRLIGCEPIELPIWAAPEVENDVFSPYIHTEVIEIDGAPHFRGQLGWPRPAAGNDMSIVSQVALKHGLKLADESLEVFTMQEDEDWAYYFMRERPGNPVIVLNRRSAARYKEYPAGQWQSVVTHLTGVATVLELSPPREALRGTEPVWPLPSLRRISALFRKVHCVVTVDSFAAHLATAVGTPAVVLYGPSSPEVYGHPVNRNIRFGTCPPCYSPDEAGCVRSTCLEQIPYTMITNAVLSSLCVGRAS
jgi:ADP-heptose:LPS heptosyltransferase